MQEYFFQPTRRLPEPQATIDEDKKYSCHFEYQDLVQRLLIAKKQIEMEEQFKQFNVDNNYVAMPQIQQPNISKRKTHVPQLDMQKIESDYINSAKQHRIKHLQIVTERINNQQPLKGYPNGAITQRDKIQNQFKKERKFNFQNLQVSSSTKNQNSKKISYKLYPKQKVAQQLNDIQNQNLNKIQTENYVQNPYQYMDIQIKNKAKQTYLNRVMKRTRSQITKLQKNNTQQQLAPLDQKSSLETIKKEVTLEAFKSNNLAQTLTNDSQQSSNFFNKPSFRVKSPNKNRVLNNQITRIKDKFF